MKKYPQVAEAYNQPGAACHSAGPLDEKTRTLVKIGLSVGARMEGAVHPHVRKALDAGLTPEEIRHAVMLAMPAGLAHVDGGDEVGGRHAGEKIKFSTKDLATKYFLLIIYARKRI
jgi:hypothetical protein